MRISVRSMIVGAAILGVTRLFAEPADAQASAAAARFVVVPGSVSRSADIDTGAYHSSQLAVEVLLAPTNGARMSGLLADLYNPNGAHYKQWLRKGQFNALFAPSGSQIAAVSSYLQSRGLRVARSSSPFVIRASASSDVVAAAFKTNLHVYRNVRGVQYFANTSAVQVPASVAASIAGVVGLTSTVRVRPQLSRPMVAAKAAAPSCEAPYPTRAQLFAAVNKGTSFPFGYGGGPGCNGLTPSQENGIYGAPSLGPTAQGRGVTLAVYELSAYQRSDIAAWTRNFYGPGYRAPLIDITVDGGPLSPICPQNDTCPPDFNFYSGDVEVDADIETQLAVAPAASHLLVYEAPNDYTGQTELDLYTQIADDDLADVVSSSWGECENDAGAAYVQAENLVFEQMALQGQSVFSAAGDTGAFDCIRSDGTTIANVDDPSTQPWVTSVGGTSLESFNPGTHPNPTYPTGVETVWNVDDLCNTSSNEGGSAAHPDSGYFWCAATGAGGGGNSQFWGRPFYQTGPGVTNPSSAYGNGSTKCVLAPIGAPCREVPDVSANADEYTPYAEYCTGSAATLYSACATFTATDTVPGWFGIGGTSLSSPLWSAVIADRDGFQGSRSGNANQLLYLLYNVNPHGYFHDITGAGQLTNNNGLFPTTPGFDLATGIGTPKMSAIITGFPN